MFYLKPYCVTFEPIPNNILYIYLITGVFISEKISKNVRPHHQILGLNTLGSLSNVLLCQSTVTNGIVGV